MPHFTVRPLGKNFVVVDSEQYYRSDLYPNRASAQAFADGMNKARNIRLSIVEEAPAEPPIVIDPITPITPRITIWSRLWALAAKAGRYRQIRNKVSNSPASRVPITPAGAADGR